MSTIPRTFNAVRKLGLKKAWWQMWFMGDTKTGTLIGTDRAGNKYFENMEELPLRTRWVEYKKYDYDPAQIEPGWHAWISYLVDKPPAEDKLLLSKRPWENPGAIPNYTATPGAFKTYSTTKAKVSAWEPTTAERA